mgnify:CR=1 FL=1
MNHELITEFEFELPKGYVDGNGEIHKKGIMRLATAADEILPLRDPRVVSNPGYLTIILLSRKLEFLFDVVDKVYVINKGKLVYDGNQSIFYEDELYRYIEMPKIVEFTKYLHNEGHPILEYTDFKELIKELYRKC